MSWEVRHGDCIGLMAAMGECSIDAIVTDPPYGLEFMGKGWDSFRSDDRDVPGYNGRESGAAGEATTEGVAGTHAARRNRAVAYGGGSRATTSRCEGCGKRDQFRKAHACPEGTNWRTELVDPYSAPPTMLAFENWTREWASEALRVLKPGGHALVFGGTRTFHRLTCGLEDAGFEIRDCLSWLYGSGFPKSLDVSKAIDGAAGATREVVGSKIGQPGYSLADGPDNAVYGHGIGGSGDPVAEAEISAPATPEAAAWEGWGTALKPAWEPVVVARKPLAGTVAGNVLAHGTGALNIGGCRVEFRGDADERESKEKNRHGDFGTEQGGNSVYGDFSMLDPRANYDASGRWPANVALDEDAAEHLDEQTGELGAGNHPASRQGIGFTLNGGGVNAGTSGERRPTETGGASRFFYTAKASSAERSAGLDAFAEGPSYMVENGSKTARSGDGVRRERTTTTRNLHPTVKPVELMRWLVRLVTPPGGGLLDPFTGSGSTGIAAVLEGFDFIGLEREADYIAIAQSRIAWWERHRGEGSTAEVLEAAQARHEVALAGQGSLFDGGDS